MDSNIINPYLPPSFPPSLHPPPTNTFWKDLITHWLNLILKSDQGLVLTETQTNRSTRYKNLQKQSNEDFFTWLFKPCLHFTKNKFTIPMHIEEILGNSIILNPHTKLSFSSNNPNFYSISPKKYYRQIYYI